MANHSDFVRVLKTARLRAWVKIGLAAISPHYVHLRRRVRKQASVSQQERMQAGEASLLRLIRHCRTNVPYYRETFPRVVLGPKLGIESFPILEKHQLRTRFADLIARDASQRIRKCDDIVLSTTSGSTGSPTNHLKISPDEELGDLVLLTRLARRLKLPISGEAIDVGLRWIGQPLIELRLIPGSYVTWNLRPYRADRADHAREFEEVLRLVRPKVIFGMPSRLMELVRIARSLGVTLRPAAVISSYEPLTDECRRQLQEEFQSVVVSVYGTCETGLAATECACGRMHFDEDLVLPEILREDDTAAEPGETGRLVLTSLKSWLMPLVRYDTGDLATVNGLCSCGDPSLSITRLDGRSTPMITTCDGRRLPAYRIMSYLAQLGLDEYQLVQESPECFTLIVQPNQPLNDRSAMAQCENDIAQYLKQAVRIDIDRSGEFHRTITGKRNPFIEFNDR